MSWQVDRQGQDLYYHDEQDKFRGHWGIASNVPPEASAIQVTPTSFVSVTKWTRTQTNRLLFDAGFGVYDQEYQENYQPDVFAQTRRRSSRSPTTATGKIAAAWNNPADHFSKLCTEQLAASLRHRLALDARRRRRSARRDWRLSQQYTGDVQPITYNAGAPVVDHAPPADRPPQLDQRATSASSCRTTGRSAARRSTPACATTSSSARRCRNAAGEPFNQAVTYGNCSDGKNNLNAGCIGPRA